MDNLATVLIAFLVIVPALYFLIRSIRLEVVEGKCASCYHKNHCRDGCCEGEPESESS